MEKYLISLEEAIKLIEKQFEEGNLELHEDSFGLYGDDIETAIPLVRLNFGDFVKNVKDFNGKDDSRIYETNYPLINVLNSYDFETRKCSNYHHVYSNGVMINVHQLNYGTNLPDISDDGELKERLLERIEFAHEEFYNEDHRDQFAYFFGDILSLFFEAVDNANFTLS